MGNELKKCCCEPEQVMVGNPGYPPSQEVQGTAWRNVALPGRRRAYGIDEQHEEGICSLTPLFQSPLLAGSGHEFSMMCPEPSPTSWTPSSAAAETPSADEQGRRSWQGPQHHGGSGFSSRMSALAGSQVHDDGGGIGRTRSDPTTVGSTRSSAPNMMSAAGRTQSSSSHESGGYAMSQTMKDPSFESQFFLRKPKEDVKQQTGRASSEDDFGRTSSDFSRTSSTGTVISGRMIVEAEQSHQTPLVDTQVLMIKGKDSQQVAADNARLVISPGVDQETEAWRFLKKYQDTKLNWRDANAQNQFDDMVAEAREAGVEYEHLKRMLDHSREVTFHLAAKYFNEKNGGAQVIHRNGPSSYGTGPNGTLLAPCVDHLDTNEFRRQVKDCLGTGAVGGDKINSNIMRMRPEETQRWKDLVERNTESLRVVSGHLITKESSIFKNGLDEVKGKFHLLINNSKADNPDYWREHTYRFSRQGQVDVSSSEGGVQFLCDLSKIAKCSVSRGLFVPHLIHASFKGDDAKGEGRKKVCFGFASRQMRDDWFEHIGVLRECKATVLRRIASVREGNACATFG